MPDAHGNKLPEPDTLPDGDEPIIAWATIIREKTDDGLIVVEKDYLGARIAVNLRSIRSGTIYDTISKQYHHRQIIYKIDPATDWIPTELLEFELGDHL